MISGILPFNIFRNHQGLFPALFYPGRPDPALVKLAVRPSEIARHTSVLDRVIGIGKCWLFGNKTRVKLRTVDNGAVHAGDQIPFGPFHELVESPSTVIDVAIGGIALDVGVIGRHGVIERFERRSDLRFTASRRESVCRIEGAAEKERKPVSVTNVIDPLPYDPILRTVIG